MISKDIAQTYLARGLSALPANKVEKHSTVRSWKKYQTRLPTSEEIDLWFETERDAVCIVAGTVSGNLECIDFDHGAELYDAWAGRIAPELLARLVVERTQSGGKHVLYRCETPVGGNLKLARGIRDGKETTLIETRGEGGLFLCAPTDGYCLEQNDFETVPTLKTAERNTLLEAARALDEVAATPVSVSSTGPSTFSLRPGDDFCARGDLRPFLEYHGWKRLGSDKDGNERWQRPGKAGTGTSATFNGEVFYVFSSNAVPFESNHGYNAFQAFALLEHAGDFSAAAADLLEQGYGSEEETGVDISAIVSTSTESRTSQKDSDKKTKAGRILNLEELTKTYPKMREPLIHGFLRIGETMNIIAPPKTGKSWLVTDLALSVAMGRDWFGFPCAQGKVLILDNELHAETSAARIPKVVAARGLRMEEVWHNIFIDNQRGRLENINDIGARLDEFAEYGFRLIIIDAFYRAMPVGTDENDNGAIAGVYNRLDRYAQRLSCAFALIHHTSKGNQALKGVTDVGAGAGAQSRATDTHIVLRRHAEENVVVMDSVVRSFPPVEPFCLRWTWPVWNRDDTLDPADLEGKGDERHRPTPEARRAMIEQTAAILPSIIDEDARQSKAEFVDRVRDRYSLSRADARQAVERALCTGDIELRRDGSGRNGRPSAFICRPG